MMVEYKMNNRLRFEPDIILCSFCNKAWKRKYPLDPRNVTYLNAHSSGHGPGSKSVRFDPDTYDEEWDSRGEQA